MPSNIRLKRIQEQILKVLTDILETRVHDPRVEGVYITDVTVDRELDYANIYVSSLDGVEKSDEILEGLENACGFIRYNLSQEVKLHMMPQLRFYWDDTPERAERIEALLADIREEREARLENQEDILDATEEVDDDQD